MQMWRHALPSEDINVHFKQDKCVFCGTNVIVESIENRWQLDESFLRTQHETSIDILVEHGEDTYAEHREIISEFHLEDVCFHCCPACGWWCIVQLIQYDTPNMPYMAYRWAAGALTREEFPEIDAPLSEVRSYLCARYDQRFVINPYRLEDIVASIFRSFGCDVQLSSRSHDGGPDVFGFDRCGQAFGVQVKRYRRRIGVEPIRSFIGALMLHGQLRGVFVTTSDFTTGATRLCGQAKRAGIQLKFADANKLFEMIKAAQILNFDQANLQQLALSYAQGVPALNYGVGMHMNSL
jgi:restriction system protein